MSGRGTCLPCQNHSVSAAGSDDVADCVCNAGYVMIAAHLEKGTGVNVVAYGGKDYRTLDDWDPEDSSFGCQDEYMAVPAGWEMVQNNADSIAVTTAHPWLAPVSARVLCGTMFSEPYWVQVYS